MHIRTIGSCTILNQLRFASGHVLRSALFCKSSLLCLIILAMPCLLLSRQDPKKKELALAAVKRMIQNDAEFKRSELSSAVIKTIQNLLKDNPTFVESVIVQSMEQLYTDVRYFDRLQQDNAHVKEIIAMLGWKNHANNINTIIAVPIDNKQYFMRISGQAHRDANVACTLGIRTGRALDLFVKHQHAELTLQEEQELDLFKHNNPKTVQTISQVAFYRFVKQALQFYKIKTIRIPVTGLVHVPGRPVALEDKNYVVVQEKLSNIVSLWKHPQLCKRVTKQQIADLKKVIQFAGLWDIKSNLFLCLPTSQHPKEQLALIDFEQPSCSNTDHPPYLDDVRRAQLAKQGLRELRELLIYAHPDMFDEL